MFATLSSFLPSALQQGSPNPANPPSKDPHPPLTKVEDPKPKDVIVDEGSIKRKEKRTNHESFIVVRPPPAKSNHPLNLQVQLVPPQSRERDRTRSLDVPQSSQDQEDTILSRTSSNRSDVSMYSGYSSVTSFSSVTSTSTASSRRMIIPLYNLQAHNVMTNVVVDAGTDAKVAKFQKRGLEILGLAVLEPVEVFGSGHGLPQIPPSSNRTSIDDHQDPALAPQFALRPGGAESVYTPTSSAHSLSSGDNPSLSPSNFMRPDMDATPTSGTKKIFGKFFKKKDNQPSSPSPSAMSSPIGNFIIRPPRSATGQSLAIPSQGNTKRNSLLSQELSTSPPSSIPTTSSYLQPPILGIHPSCSSPKYPPQGRPHSYTWVVRKWIKGSNGGLLDNVIGHMNQLGLSDDRRQSRTPPEEGVVEVHFVWSRGKKKRKVLRDGNQTVGANRRANTMFGSGGGHPDKRGSVSPPSRSATADRAEKRFSATSGQSMSTTSEVGSSAGRLREEDDGDESEPEDSETPWTCTLVLSRVGEGGGGAMSPATAAATAAADGTSNHTRVRVATFSPTPHHPKVVALLKVPFPLPDIIVDRRQVCRRAVSPQGIARPSWNLTIGGGGGDEPDGLVLHAYV